MHGTVIVKTRGDKHSTQKEQEIELYVLNLPGNLASALCAFDVSICVLTSWWWLSLYIVLCLFSVGTGCEYYKNQRATARCRRRIS